MVLCVLQAKSIKNISFQQICTGPNAHGNCTLSSDEETVREIHPEVIGSDSINVTWKKPHSKYKEFSYRAFKKWTNPDKTKSMLERCKGSATFCVYDIKDMPAEHKFYVMAFVIGEIPLVRIVGRYLLHFFKCELS